MFIDKGVNLVFEEGSRVTFSWFDSEQRFVIRDALCSPYSWFGGHDNLIGSLYRWTLSLQWRHLHQVVLHWLALHLLRGPWRLCWVVLHYFVLVSFWSFAHPAEWCCHVNFTSSCSFIQFSSDEIVVRPLIEWEIWDVKHDVLKGCGTPLAQDIWWEQHLPLRRQYIVIIISLD